MRRLVPAALIALACHGLVFLLDPVDTATKPRLKAARQPVNINLAHFVPAAPKPPPPEVRKQPPPPKPKPKPEPPNPKPKPKPKPKPPPKPRPKPQPQPKPVAPEPPQVALEAPPPAPAQRATKVAAVADPGPPRQAPLKEATPLYADNPPPRYPRSARRRGHQGTVLLAVHVNVEGRVDDLELRTSSGFKVLDEAALEAVRTWRFASGRRGDTPVAMWVEVPIRFELQR
jgi:protein TonB